MPPPADDLVLALQQRYQRLVAQVEDTQARLDEWQQQAARFRSDRARLTDAPAAALAERHAELVERLDSWLARAEPVPGIDAGELREALCTLAGELIDCDDLAAARRAGIRALHDRHAALPWDQVPALRRQGRQTLRPTGPQVFPDDHDAAASATAAAGARVAARQVREVYRRLASTLHPDRAGDPRDQLARTALMQRLNRAYEARDLLTLVRLEDDTERHDFRDSLFAEGDEGTRLLEALTRRLVGLQARINGYESAFRDAYFFSQIGPLEPGCLDRLIDEELRSLLLEKAEAERDLRDLETVRGLRRFVERARAAQRAPDDPADLY